MDSLSFEEKWHRVLLALYHISTTKTRNVDVYELEATADVGRPDFYDVLRDIGRHGKSWLYKAGEKVRITPEGVIKAEEVLKMKMAEKVRMVLRKIYDLGGDSHMKFVDIPDLQRELDMSQNELFSIINWAEKNTNWFDDNMDQAVRLSPDGVQEVESPSSERRGGGDTYNTNFNAPIQAAQIGGSRNVQKNVFNNNPKIDETADALIKIIQSSGIAELDKEDIVNDIERIKALAAKEQTPEVASRIKDKFEAVKSGLDLAERGGDLALKAAPYLSTLWQLLTTLNS